MPHLRIEYTANLDERLDMGDLCQLLAQTLTGMLDAGGKPVFPLYGTRVLAYPAAHAAVGDGDARRSFMYLNLRIAPGRSEALVQAAGEALLAAAQSRLAPIMDQLPLRLTLHIDSSVPDYEGKFSN